jgi:hypothetical protein
MCYRKSSARANVEECSLCGVNDFVMHDDGDHIFCDRCYNVRLREQRADEDLVLPPPGYDIEEVGRQ